MTDPVTHASGSRRLRRPTWAWLIPTTMLLIAIAIPLLVWYAADAILHSADGQLTEQNTDPSQPGYEVLVLPSPSLMVFGLDPAGHLASVTIASLASNDRGGTALFIPPETMVPQDEAVGGDRRIVDIYETEGVAATRLAVATLIDINVDDLTVLDAPGWTRIVEPVAPIRIGFDSDVTLAVAADQTAEFLSVVNEGEAPAARVARQVEFWRAWVAQIAESSDPAAVPGELNEGIGRLLHGLANGQAVVETIDAVDIVLENGSPAVEVDIDELRALIVQMIPFPLPVEPGARPRVRLLDGTGELDVASLYARSLVLGGAQIVIIGNAETFDVAQTVVVYHDDRFEEEALSFGETLGGAEVSFEPLADAVLDVTIIVGSDQTVALGG